MGGGCLGCVFTKRASDFVVLGLELRFGWMLHLLIGSYGYNSCHYLFGSVGLGCSCRSVSSVFQ